jgi:hypothetical protein
MLLFDLYRVSMLKNAENYISDEGIYKWDELL